MIGLVKLGFFVNDLVMIFEVDIVIGFLYNIDNGVLLILIGSVLDLMYKWVFVSGLCVMGKGLVRVY